MSKLVLIVLAALALTSCGGRDATNTEEQLSSPTITITGTGVSTVGARTYVFADVNGTVATTTNTVKSLFDDTNLPLILSGISLYSTEMVTGNCSALNPMPGALDGGSDNSVLSNFSATACSDQAVINILINTTVIADQQKFHGVTLLVLPITVDVAPEVSTVAAGNSAADGTGTANSAGIFTIASDHSIVVTFSKDMTSGTFNATLTGTGCSAATVGTSAIVSGSNGRTIAWQVTPGSIASATACTFNVSGVTDTAGNPDDPSDTNINTTVTFN